MERIKKISLENNYRAIFISDIHGDLDSLKLLLNKVSYKKGEDYLFILGDIIEKGLKNLDTLNYVIELSEIEKVHVLIGNCDYLLEELDNLNEELFEYANFRKKSILWDMNNEKREFNFSLLQELKSRYQKHINFIKSLPYIIDTNQFTVCHAAVLPSEDYLNTPLEYALKTDNHGFVDYKYNKTLIMGHWAASLYHQNYYLYPFFNNKNNTISIDGANSIKNYGQLNALILNKEKEIKYSYDFIDFLPRIKVIKKQEKTEGEKIIWPYNKVNILETDDIFHKVELLSYGTRGIREDSLKQKIAYVPKGFVNCYNNEYFCKEFGNYLLSLEEGDYVSLVNNYDPNYCIVKSKGELGLAKKESLDI